MRYEPAAYYKPVGLNPRSPEFTQIVSSSRSLRRWPDFIVEEMRDRGGAARGTIARGYRIAMLLNGGVETWWRDSSFGRWRKGRPGTISLAPPGPSAPSSWLGMRHFILVSVNTDFIRSVVDPETHERMTAMPMHYCLEEYYPDATTGQQLLTTLLKMIRNPSPVEPLAAEQIGIALVEWIARLAGSRNRFDPCDGLCRTQLLRTTDYIDAHLSAEFTLRDLARVVDVSPFHFSRLFKKSVGLSPWQYVMRWRVDRAIEMLVANRQSSLSAVALACGFADQSHLTRVFKRVQGSTPSEFIRHSRR